MRYIITAGGTGGHLYPAISIAKALCENNHEVIFIGSKSRLDKKLLMNQNFKVKHYKMYGYRRSFSLGAIFFNVKNLFYTFMVLVSALVLIIRFKPNKIIGFGGYITYPILKAGSILRKKTYIHEQNSYPGLTNRQLAKQVNKIFYCYESCINYFNLNDEEKFINSSNPRINQAYEYLSLRELDYYLFLGGSLGAEKINKLAYDFAFDNSDKEVYLVCGDRYINEFEHKLKNLKVFAFLDDQLKYIKEAKYVVTRGGATTLLECMALDKRTIIIPSPNVVADHQTKNAMELISNPLFEMINEDDYMLTDLNEKISKLCNVNIKKQEKIDSIKIILKELEGKNE